MGTGVMLPQLRNAKDWWQPPEPGRGKEGFFPRAFEREKSPKTPWFWTSSLQNCEKINFYCFSPPGLWYFVTTALETNTMCLAKNMDISPFLYVWIKNYFIFIDIKYSYLCSHGKIQKVVYQIITSGCLGGRLRGIEVRKFTSLKVYF